MILGAQNVTATGPMPPALWWNVLVGVLCGGAGVAYALSETFRGSFVPLAVLSIVYGTWSASSSYPLMMSLIGALHGDAIAIAVLSGVAFVLVGVLHLATRLRFR